MLPTWHTGRGGVTFSLGPCAVLRKLYSSLRHIVGPDETSHFAPSMPYAEKLRGPHGRGLSIVMSVVKKQDLKWMSVFLEGRDLICVSCSQILSHPFIYWEMGSHLELENRGIMLCDDCAERVGRGLIVDAFEAKGGEVVRPKKGLPGRDYAGAIEWQRQRIEERWPSKSI